MTQGIIVIPFFVVIWTGMLALCHMYEARMRAQGDASLMALSGAAEGQCGDASMTAADQLEGGPVLGAEESGMLERIAGVHPLAVSHTRAQAERQASAFGEQRMVNGNRILMCNTRPVDNLPELITEYVQEMLGVGDD